MGIGTATEVVRGIGSVDLIMAGLIVVTIVGILRGSGSLYRFALSPIALAIFVWATIWGFMTAVSRPLGAGVFWPEILDVVERGPNWMLPGAILFITLLARRSKIRQVAPKVERPRPEPRHPTPAVTA
jgi:hypothetical protein